MIDSKVEDPIEEKLKEEELSVFSRRERWNEVKDDYIPIVKRLKALGVEVSLSGELDLRFSGDKAKLTSVIRVLRTSGFSTKEDPPKANSSYWSARFFDDKQKLDFWLSFSSTICRQVKVGTETVERDVFETRCD